MDDLGPNPSGLCECGCGEQTTRAVNTSSGYQVGQYQRFIKGHRSRLQRQPLTPGERQLSINPRYRGAEEGFLVVLQQLDSNYYWCKCTANGVYKEGCVGFATVGRRNFLSGNTRSCGCLTHKQALPRICTNPGCRMNSKTTRSHAWTDTQSKPPKEYILCDNCYQLVQRRGSLNYYICAMPGCTRRVWESADSFNANPHLGVDDDAPDRRICWECRQEHRIPTDAAYHHAWLRKLWPFLLETPVAQWDQFELIDRDGDCVLWTGAHIGDSPAYRERLLRRDIYLTFVEPQHDGYVFRCPRHASCVHPGHLSSHMTVTRSRFTEDDKRMMRAQYEGGATFAEIADDWRIKSVAQVGAMCRQDPNFRSRTGSAKYTPQSRNRMSNSASAYQALRRTTNTIRDTQSTEAQTCKGALHGLLDCKAASHEAT